MFSLNNLADIFKTQTSQTLQFSNDILSFVIQIKWLVIFHSISLPPSPLCPSWCPGRLPSVDSSAQSGCSLTSTWSSYWEQRQKNKDGKRPESAYFNSRVHLDVHSDLGCTHLQMLACRGLFHGSTSHHPW